MSPTAVLWCRQCISTAYRGHGPPAARQAAALRRCSLDAVRPVPLQRPGGRCGGGTRRRRWSPSSRRAGHGSLLPNRAGGRRWHPDGSARRLTGVAGTCRVPAAPRQDFVTARSQRCWRRQRGSIRRVAALRRPARRTQRRRSGAGAARHRRVGGGGVRGQDLGEHRATRTGTWRGARGAHPRPLDQPALTTGRNGRRRPRAPWRSPRQPRAEAWRLRPAGPA